MRFNVLAATPANPPVLGYAPMPGDPPLRTALIEDIVTGKTPDVNRQLTLNEVMGPGGPLEILVNNTKWNGERITGVDKTDPNLPMYIMEPIPGFTLDGTGKNYLSELPNEGETEIWEIINLTADAHPIHLHLVQFQLMNRQNFDAPAHSAAARGWKER